MESENRYSFCTTLKTRKRSLDENFCKNEYNFLGKKKRDREGKKIENKLRKYNAISGPEYVELYNGLRKIEKAQSAFVCFLPEKRSASLLTFFLLLPGRKNYTQAYNESVSENF